MKRKVAKGMQLIHLAGMILITLMISALAIDFGYYFAEQNRLQTTADSAALAASTQLYRSNALNTTARLNDATSTAMSFVSANEPDLQLAQSDVSFGYVDPSTKIYNANNFTTPSSDPAYSATGGYNAISVRVQRSTGSTNPPMKTLMANMFGVSTMNNGAFSVAMIDSSTVSITNGGLRPIYVCLGELQLAMQQSGILENQDVRIYGDHVEVNGVGNIANCPTPGSGNWGFADFTNSNIGASTIRDWFANGYPGVVSAGQTYGTKPGNFIASMTSELDALVANQTIFPVPLYNSWSGNGANSQVSVTGFVGFQITNYVAHGAQASRYIEGHFTRYVCNTGCTSGTSGYTPAGGDLVKIRLAYQS